MAAPDADCNLLLVYIYIQERHNHSGPSNFVLSQEANEEFNEYFDNTQDLSRQASGKCAYLKAMLGKNPVHILRIAGILEAFHEGFDYVMLKSKEKFELTVDYTTQLNEHIKSLPSNVLISRVNMQRSFYLLEYFNKTKLILSGEFKFKDS
jgi:hypothetical protein